MPESNDDPIEDDDLISGYVPASKEFTEEPPSASAEDIQAKINAVRLKYSMARKTLVDDSEADIVSSYLHEHQIRPAPEDQIEVVHEPHNSSNIDVESEWRACHRLSQFPPYFAQLPDALLTTKRVSPDAKLVYALIHKHAPIKNLNRNPVVQISQETLADELGRTEVTIRTLINQLLEAGWIGKYRQGKMKVNRYVLYPMSRHTWAARIAMERVQLRISRDQCLAKRLRDSLYPISDQKNPYGHSNSAKERVTISPLLAY